MFGTFVTKAGKKELKQYGATFTCHASRAIHLEIVHLMESVSFTMCLRRFSRRRWNVGMLKSDYVSNLTESDEELKSILEMSHKQIRVYLQNSGSDWVIWKKINQVAVTLVESGKVKSD